MEEVEKFAGASCRGTHYVVRFELENGRAALSLGHLFPGTRASIGHLLPGTRASIGHLFGIYFASILHLCRLYVASFPAVRPLQKMQNRCNIDAQ